MVDVLGDSMDPTIFDRDAALVDESRRSPLSGKIYALRAADGLLVKRLRKRDHRWWAASDNEEYEPQPLDDVARIMGRVVGGRTRIWGEVARQPHVEREESVRVRGRCRVVWWGHTDLG